MPAAPVVSEAQRARVRARLFGAAVEPTAPLVGGKYRRVALLGEGGIGTVWEVEHVVVGRRFALKLLRDPERESSARQRFLREARAASSVGHAHIVEVTDAGETDDGMPYVVMELLRGQTLAQGLDEGGPMPWARVRKILEQLAGALAHAHRIGIIHRDLKAENVMLLARSDGADFCKIVDFGLAKVVAPDRTQHSRPGSIFGTPACMSPEQILGEPIDIRTDVYALGCLAFHMLSARRPFVAPTREAVFALHLAAPIPSVGVIEGQPTLGARLDRLLADALAKRREDRLADMDAFVAAVARVDQNDKRSMPRRTRVALAAAVGLVGAVGIAMRGDDDDGTEAARETNISPAAIVQEPGDPPGHDDSGAPHVQPSPVVTPLAAPTHLADTSEGSPVDAAPRKDRPPSGKRVPRLRPDRPATAATKPAPPEPADAEKSGVRPELPAESPIITPQSVLTEPLPDPFKGK